MIPYNITPSDLSNIKLKSNSIVFMFTVCYSSGESACDPQGGISLEEAKLRTESYSKMFLGRGSKCYFASNLIKSPFDFFNSGLTIKDVRNKLVGTTDYDKYFTPNHVVVYNKSNVRYGGKMVLRNTYGYCLVGDFSYNINTLRGK
jgi:hypothetical protein